MFIRFVVHEVYDSMELLQHTLQMVNRLFYPFPIKTDFQDSAHTSCWNGTLSSFQSNFYREMIWLSVPSKVKTRSRVKNDGIGNLESSMEVVGSARSYSRMENCNRHFICKTVSFQVFLVYNCYGGQ